ncbi:hypothetical protein M9Y10_035071 [Tritrichomonas musculus]|uniref:Uncharacterized protein n=1 Tax=Tritrichomonas musculus TaxID=1915356 RepID=A0ABR2KHL1_9EUKA
MIGLDVHFHSIQIDKSVIHSGKVRVTVMAYPNNNQESFIIESKNMNNVDHVLTVNVSSETKTLLFLFEKKNIFQNDPIIASTDVNAKEIPFTPNDPNNNDIKSINIYEPVIYQDDNTQSPYENRKIIGKLIFKFTLTNPDLPTKSTINQIFVGKVHKGQSYSKANTLYNDENAETNNLLN